MFTFIVRWKENNTKNLIECLNSIDNQPNIEKEILLITEESESKKNISKGIQSKYKFQIHFFKKIDKQALEEIVRETKGEYIQFMDEEDRITIDWCYAVKMSGRYDLLLGNQIYKDDKIFEYNLSCSKYFSESTTKDELLKVYFNHGGEDRYLREINNKVIRKSLLEKVLQEKEQVFKNEDFLFQALNIACLTKADKIYCMQNGYYIYGIKKESLIFGKDFNDIIREFSEFIGIIENILMDINIDVSVEWKKDWYRELINTLYLYNGTKLTEILKNVQEICGDYFNPLRSTSYYEKLTTELGDSFKYYFRIKEYIASKECKRVGYDIFDTLIQRPFWEPTDLFKLLNNEFNRLVGKSTVIDFSLIRINGERACRAYYITVRPSNEDVTLDEIYDYISEEYGISKKITNAIKKYEIDLEKRYCTSRKIGKELYKWTKYCQKPIYIISDMYLSQKVIEEILHKNGYLDYKKLYLSNEVGVSKYSGNLFDYFLEDEKITDPTSVCFIGDNYSVDFCNSQKRKMVAFHVPKATEVFEGLNGAIYAGEIFKNIYAPNGGIIDQGTVLKFLGIRCMLAVVANEFFGNPFVTFNEKSDFNSDGRLVGYFCAGMFLFSEAQWLIGESTHKEIEKIHFVARDGYLVKKVYDKLKKIYIEAAESNYLYFSRKAVAPLYMDSPEGIYELFLPPHILSNTPLKVIKFLHVVVKDDIDITEILKSNGIIPFKKFTTLNEFYKFSKVFKEELYDAVKAKEYKNIMQQYFGELIGRRDVIFDVGYSGRMETALTKLLGYPVNSYYFHEHEPWALMRKENIGFTIDSFYSFKPCSAFVLREQIFTPAQPSCIGFKKNGDHVEPEFGTYKASYKEEFILTNIQNWALKFADDMLEIFKDDIKQLVYNRFDACIPFEYYMHYAKEFDRQLMWAVDFEDEFGTNEVLSICEYWEKEQQIYKLFGEYRRVEMDVEQKIEIKKQLRQEIYREEGIFEDGLFVNFYKSINKMLPIGSKKRNFIKKIVKVVYNR